jgi:hypothetical protein
MDYSRDIDEENHAILHYTEPGKEYCFVEKNNGYFLVYKKLGEHVYEFQNAKLTSLSECNQWLEENNYSITENKLDSNDETEPLDLWKDVLTPEQRNNIINTIATNYDPLIVYGKEGMKKWLKKYKFRNIDKHLL